MALSFEFTFSSLPKLFYANKLSIVLRCLDGMFQFIYQGGDVCIPFPEFQYITEKYPLPDNLCVSKFLMSYGEIHLSAWRMTFNLFLHFMSRNYYWYWKLLNDFDKCNANNSVRCLNILPAQQSAREWKSVRHKDPAQFCWVRAMFVNSVTWIYDFSGNAWGKTWI